MKYGISVLRSLLQRLDGFCGRQHQQFDAALLGLTLHILHHGKATISPGPDDEARALPGDVLFQG